MISIENLEKKAYFNIDNNEYYEGYHIEDRRWNGWATPSFEKYVADLIAHNFSTSNFKIKYDEKNDYYRITEKEDGKIIRAIAAKSGKSVQAYVLQAIWEKMEREGYIIQPSPDTDNK